VGFDLIIDSILHPACSGSASRPSRSWQLTTSSMMALRSALAAALCVASVSAIPQGSVAALSPPDFRLANCTATGWNIRDPKQVEECLKGAQEAIYCDDMPFNQKRYPGEDGPAGAILAQLWGLAHALLAHCLRFARFWAACHNRTFDYSPITGLHEVHL
jgi:hypothetical protein